MRTNLPWLAARRASERTLSVQRSGSTPRPRPVSFTLTLASSPSASIVAMARPYSSRIATASSAVATSSPRTSRVAFFPWAFSARTVATASARSAPAM